MTSHDGTLATMIGSAATRIVCQNTFGHAMGEAKKKQGQWWKVRHTQGGHTQLREVEAALQALVEGWAVYSESAAHMAETVLSRVDAMDLIQALIPDPVAVDGRVPSNAKAQAKRDAILWELDNGAGADLSSARGTAWGLFNAVTAWSTWGAPVRGGDSARWDSALLGAGADLSSQAFAVISAL